jgi:farnesyl diphosphate synthase
LHEAMRYAVLNGGKRLRGLLVYATGSALGVTLDALDPIACAIECMHAYSLVHDDLPSMDNDALRRGQPACHIAFDEATALLAGSALQNLAYELISHASFDATRRIQMIACLCKASGSEGMMGGQSLDLASDHQRLSYEALIELYALKTTELLSASIRLAVLASTRNLADLPELDRYAQLLGPLFQIQDDLLDIEVSTKALGKPQGSDKAQNKTTVPSLIGMGKAKALIEDLYSKLAAVLNSAESKLNIALLSEITDYIKQRRY